MNPESMTFVSGVVGLAVGALLMWMVHRRVLRSDVAGAKLEAEAQARVDISALREAVARHETEASLTARHGNVAELLAPIRETLSRYDEVLAQLGRSQAQSAGAIGERLEAVALAGESLRSETHRLAQALRAPTVRGQWGELQLRRVCELAGMLEYCDFDTQVTVQGADGALRPDVVVRLPGDRQLVVDAKAPLMAYLDAAATNDERRRQELLLAHAGHVRSHVQRLSAKKYWAQFSQSPEFVVLFLPGEAFFAAALEADPSLLEMALTERVLLATPITLIALLKAAAYGWNQQRVAADTAQVIALGTELQRRIVVFSEQMHEVGKGLQRAVTSFNRAVGSMDSRVLVTARKLSELQHGASDLPVPALVETLVREARLSDDQQPNSNMPTAGASAPTIF